MAKQTRVDAIVFWTKNNKVTAWIILACIGFSALGTVGSNFVTVKQMFGSSFEVHGVDMQNPGDFSRILDAPYNDAIRTSPCSFILQIQNWRKTTQSAEGTASPAKLQITLSNLSDRDMIINEIAFEKLSFLTLPSDEFQSIDTSVPNLFSLATYSLGSDIEVISPPWIIKAKTTDRINIAIASGVLPKNSGGFIRAGDLVSPTGCFELKVLLRSNLGDAYTKPFAVIVPGNLPTAGLPFLFPQ